MDTCPKCSRQFRARSTLLAHLKRITPCSSTIHTVDQMRADWSGKDIIDGRDTFTIALVNYAGDTSKPYARAEIDFNNAHGGLRAGDDHMRTCTVGLVSFSIPQPSDLANVVKILVLTRKGLVIDRQHVETRTIADFYINDATVAADRNIVCNHPVGIPVLYRPGYVGCISVEAVAQYKDGNIKGIPMPAGSILEINLVFRTITHKGPP